MFGFFIRVQSHIIIFFSDISRVLTLLTQIAFKGGDKRIKGWFRGALSFICLHGTLSIRLI